MLRTVLFLAHAHAVGSLTGASYADAIRTPYTQVQAAHSFSQHDCNGIHERQRLGTRRTQATCPRFVANEGAPVGRSRGQPVSSCLAQAQQL